jgi:hypothetical protein
MTAPSATSSGPHPASTAAARPTVTQHVRPHHGGRQERLGCADPHVELGQGTRDQQRAGRVVPAIAQVAVRDIIQRPGRVYRSREESFRCPRFPGITMCRSRARARQGPYLREMSEGPCPGADLGDRAGDREHHRDRGIHHAGCAGRGRHQLAARAGRDRGGRDAAGCLVRPADQAGIQFRRGAVRLRPVAGSSVGA